MIFLALPFLFIPFIWTFPAGLLVYWITTNTWTIVQQYIVRKTVGPMQPPDLSMLTDRGGKSSGGDGDGRAGPRSRTPAPAGAVSAGAAGGNGANGAPRGRTAPPPPPPRRKKKQRSGRRR
jgi:YidC/Oxa1 family membrane protein insertase